SLRGQTVLVTGGGSGMGALFALGAAQRGASHVVIWDINTQAAQDVAQQVAQLGVHSSYDVVDLTDNTSVDQAGEAVRQRLGEIDFLINNAGVVSGKTFLAQDHQDVE